MSVGDLIRYLFIGALGLVLLIVGMKVWGKQKTEKRMVSELRVLANPTSSFEQLYAADAEKALYKTMAQLRIGEEKLNQEPGKTLEKVFRGKGDGALFPELDPGADHYSDPRETLIREGILRNYQHCRTLGVFDNHDNIRRLNEGEAPEIMAGPDKGGNVAIRYIISPEVSPGVEKLVPNMIIGPPLSNEEKSAKPTDLQIKQAKSLATLLTNAGLLEREAEDRIVAHYDKLGTPLPPEPKPAPRAEPEPEPEAEPEAEAEKETEPACPFE